MASANTYYEALAPTPTSIDAIAPTAWIMDSAGTTFAEYQLFHGLINEDDDEAYYMMVTFGAKETSTIEGSSDNVGVNYLAL
eukprot:CAMPEP_0176359582 /NCGR_PEP_ID=MMETSP0126-20121128/16485_1 /TAXON_ID=141414 ORGANISM="Strombidinopsis acuminatum, Strain SPMC142" /NCGR_SAMPLE_ID=MMETSP0126 /ASSEMBLY_ACC=CAM_ASM_000229 /LENGTH=81 /DNA_ID=CAMNT_0017714469 /DNA_START=7 /DNA_END=252 /DNA_ORIENTATION=+